VFLSLTFFTLNSVSLAQIRRVEQLSKAKIKWLKSLQQKKHRDEEQVFVVEGEKMVLEGLDAIGFTPELLVTASDYDLPAGLLLPENTFKASAVQMEQASALKTPNKLLAVFRRPAAPLPDTGLFIALDGVQDPGNLGTIMRLADWFGAAGILCSESTVDCYNPKVIQASMGAIFRIPVKYCDLKAEIEEMQLPVFGALLDGENYSQTDYPENCVLLLGNEGNGISETLKSSVTTPVTIPRYGSAESLNVAAAGAILLAEIKRSLAAR
jgi:RNA methyltransferase, TrmH family